RCIHHNGDGVGSMSYSNKQLAVILTGVLAVGVAAAGCATPWFGSRTTSKGEPAPATTNNPGDLEQVVAGYINGVCKLPKEQRDATFRELNEALLPNHAAISCGRGGDL